MKQMELETHKKILYKTKRSGGGRKDYKIDCIAAEFKDWEVSWEN